jgi:hypothetical protein
MTRVFVAPVSRGLGDLVVSLPAAQAFIDEGRRGGNETWLVARSPSQALLAARVAGLTGYVHEGDHESGKAGDRFVDLRDHPLQRDFWWGSPVFEATFGPLNINEILSRICADLGVAADFSRPVPLVAYPRPELEGSVLLVTETDGPWKTWPSQRWPALAGRLQDAGFPVRQVARHRPRAGMATTGIPVVVGVDTGLTHIAVQQGIPTVTICRRGSMYPRPWGHSRVLRGGACTGECTEAEAAYAHNDRISLQGFDPPAWTCPSRAICLEQAGVEEAVALLRELLREPS